MMTGKPPVIVIKLTKALRESYSINMDNPLDTIYQNFLNLPPDISDPENSEIQVLPLPLDMTCSWKSGTSGGPEAIVEASHHIEHYDEEVGFEPVAESGGIATHPAPGLPADPETAARAVEETAVRLIRKDRLLVALGGEHSITYPLVKAHREIWPDLCVLQIDAHADLRDTYHGSRFNHACPMRRIYDLGVHVTALGIRSVDSSETHLLDEDLRSTFLAHQVVGRVEESIDEIVGSIPGDDLYITIDLDGLDPSVVGAVGTPVPGGFDWYEALFILRTLFREKKVVGADVVELSPREGFHSSDSAAARLVYKMVAYRAEQGRV
jgi:agmatinase